MLSRNDGRISMAHRARVHKGHLKSEMAQSSNAVPFDSDDDSENGSTTGDSTCPECGDESVATYTDRYTSYEYCTNCDWSDEDSSEPSSNREPIRKDRGRLEN